MTEPTNPAVSRETTAVDTMTQDEALQEARRRWGSSAFVGKRKAGSGFLYEVGKLRVTDSKRRVLGWSLHTWEKAFERAEQP